MNITTLIIFTLVYLILMPILYWGIGFAQKKLVVEKAMEKANKNRQNKTKIPDQIWPKWKEHIAFTRQDQSTVSLKNKAGEHVFNISNKKMYWLLYFGGLIFTMVVAAVIPPLFAWEGYLIAFLTTFLFFASVIFGINAPKKLIAERKRMMTRMFDIAKLRLGQSAEYADNPGEVIRILEWSDPITPTRVEFSVPTSFDAAGEEGFLKQFNQIFGTETSWVAYYEENKEDPSKSIIGWDYDKGIVTIGAVPPLPTMAKWAAHYVVNENVAWSYFPIALGVENGILLTNPETGEEENVLGFDLSGLQIDLAREKSLKIGGEITTSPMAFVGGGTGGGKSLSTDTPVLVVN